MAYQPTRLNGETVFRNEVFQTGLMSQLLDGVYDVSLLLILDEILPPSWLHSAVIAAPSRGELLLVKDDSPANLQELQTLVEEVSHNTANPVSPHFYRWQDGQLRLYRTNNEENYH